MDHLNHLMTLKKFQEMKEMNKTYPQRMCIVCHQMFEKRDLVRVVKSNDSTFCVDTTGKMGGRGAYVCKNSECHQKLKKTKALNKAFKCLVPNEIYEELEKKCKTQN